MLILSPKTLTLGDPKAVLTLTLDVGRERLVAPATQLLLVVYDFDLYDRDQLAKADAATDAGQSLDPFEIDSKFFTGGEAEAGGPKRRLVLPAAFIPTKAEPGTGVLAIADLNFRRAETPAEQKATESGGGQWYVNEVIGNVATSSDSPFLIGLNMFAKRDDNGVFGEGTPRRQVIGSFGVSVKDVANLESPRVLAVRLISPRDQGPLKKGMVVLSSLNKLDNPAAQSPGLRSRGIALHIRSARESLGRPGAPAPADLGTEPIPSRRAKPDLTGRYELEVEAKGVDPSSPEYIAPASLWISQAGQALVAWYLPYREIGFGEKFTGEADKHLPVGRRACLLSAQSTTFPSKSLTYWCLDAGPERIDPDRLMVNAEQTDETNDTTMLLGDLEVIESTKLVTRLELTFSRKWKLSEVSGESETAAEENATVGVFRRVAGGARMPWVCVRQMSQVPGVSSAAVEAAIRSHVEPLPMGWWAAIGRKLNSSDMAAAIERFSKFRDAVVIVEQEFERVGRLINDIVGSFPSAQYRNEALAWVQSHSRQLKLKGFGGEEKTLQEWLADIAATHLALQMDKAKKAKGSDLTADEQAAVRAGVLPSQGGVMAELGLLGGDEFEYQFEFNIITEIGLQVILGGVVGAFVCRVTRVSKDPEKKKIDYRRTFVGGFLGVSGGIGAKVSFFKKEQASGSGAPPSCKIKTFFEISERDWGTFPSCPTFKVAAVCTGLSLGGTIAEIQTALNASSSFFTVTAPGDERPSVTLSAIVENAGEWDFSPIDVSQVADKVEQGDIFSAQAVLFAISESGGIMIPADKVKRTLPPQQDMPIIPDQVSPLNSTVNAPLVAFEKGSSIIQENQRLDLDRRLALYRYLFELPGWYYCAGFTSPEYKARTQDASAANKVLSQNRAKAADDFLTSSLGEPGQGAIVAGKEHRAPIGAGREPSLRPADANPAGGGLHDPYDAKTTEEVRQREESTEYHKWRRVDLVVNATLAARVWGR